MLRCDLDFDLLTLKIELLIILRTFAHVILPRDLDL